MRRLRVIYIPGPCSGEAPTYHEVPGVEEKGQTLTAERRWSLHTARSYLEQRVGRVKLGHIAVVHNQDAIRVHDGVQAVRDGEHRAVSEGRPTSHTADRVWRVYICDASLPNGCIQKP